MSKQSFKIREAVSDDIPELAHLHVITWNATYPDEPHKPTYEIRECQWRQAFEEKNKKWFCFVIENRNGELVGFAKGKQEKNGSGNLNKIYLLKEYHGQGLGRLLLKAVANKFRGMGISMMSVVAEASNPTCAFYAKMGGVRKENNDPAVAVSVWRELPA
jgi:GNAT superfamily N-acetyltransferase